MSGGTNSVKDGRSGVVEARVQETQKPLKEGSSSFQKVLAQGVARAPGDPKSYFSGLGKITQTAGLSYNQRVEAFRLITAQVIAHPSNPYSKIEKELREEMIESLAETLADSPHPLPRAVHRIG